MAVDFSDLTKRKTVPGDDYFDRQASNIAEDQPTGSELATLTGDKLDGEAARNELQKLLEWFYHEKAKQATNRLEMAMDADFYDGQQWNSQDAAEVRSRGQMPLVYNEVAPMVDWLIGTERRSRVDWRILPRTQDDVQLADVKTKLLKYVSDVNRVPFLRSKAFADAAKVGVGWMDDGVRDDPSQEILYSKYEDWRNVLWDTCSYELDLSDARYIFRWRWVDEDVAKVMFPGRAHVIARAIERDGEGDSDGDLSWGQDGNGGDSMHSTNSGTLGGGDGERRRVKIIECQYRKPVTIKMVSDGPMRGAIYTDGDTTMAAAITQGATIIDRVMMRVHTAVFTENAMLSFGPSAFRHNKFSLTPVWCYRNSRDRMPYGMIRRVRDVQQDLNKRASKALFLVTTNQVIMDEGAVDDLDTLMEEVARPDGVIVKKHGKELSIRRDTEAATGQIQMMGLAAQSIQKTAGVSQENLGRQTNAVSGEAIKARQLQGSVVSTEPFDNLRLATQVQGEKQLSMVEQFYTQEKVIRLTESKGAIDWVKVNEPELQADGSVRFLNDLTESMADFIVSEQDYSGTMRQVMFESLNQMASRLPPEVALRLMTIALEFSDMPNHDMVADQIRKLTGEKNPNEEVTPEEQQQQAMQAQEQAEAMGMQRQQAMQALEEQAAKIREINARAAEIEAKIGASQGGEGQQELSNIRQEAGREIDRLSNELLKAKADAEARGKDSDTRIEVARIQADSRLRVAELQAQSDARLNKLNGRLDVAGQNQGAEFDS